MKKQGLDCQTTDYYPKKYYALNIYVLQLIIFGITLGFWTSSCNPALQRLNTTANLIQTTPSYSE
jgi:hypothetical protein